MTVSSTQSSPNYHIELTDGETTLGFVLCDGYGNVKMQGMQKTPIPKTTLKVAQGKSGYDDLKQPYSADVQNDWSGGRGLRDFERDSTRFYDSMRADTIFGEIRMGPKEHLTTGYFDYTTWQTKSATKEMYTAGITPDPTLSYASPVTPASTIDVYQLVFQVMGVKKTTYPFNAYAYIYSDSGGAPNTLIGQSNGYLTIKDISQTAWTTLTFNLKTKVTLTAGTTYWVAINIPTGKKMNIAQYTGGNTLQQIGTGSWTTITSGKSLVHQLITTVQGEAFFFEYKKQLYFALRSDDYQAPHVFMNGYRGLVRATNASDKSQIYTSLTLTENELAGKIIMAVEGPGSKEAINWRKIVSNTAGANATLVVNPGTQIAWTTSTHFVVLGCNTWQNVTSGSDLKYPITDVCVTDTLVYIAQGEEETDSYIVRMRYNTSGAHEFAAESTKATHLLSWVNEEGKKKVMRSSENYKVSISAAKTWGNDLSWGTPAIECGSANNQINNLALYGQPEIPYIIKEDEFGSVYNEVYAKLSPAEMASLRSDYTGMAVLKHDVFLYFSLGEGLERYFNNHLDDVGPNRDEGLPKDRRGVIKHMVGYAGRLYAAVDALDSGISSVLCNNGNGWHEIYRSGYGERIRRLFVQPLPGDTCDRLWVSQEEKVIWLPIAPNPKFQSDYSYTDHSEVVSCYINGNLNAINKYWSGLTFFCENLDGTNQYIELYYRTDDDTDDDWTLVSTTVDTSPQQELKIGSHDVTGRRFQYKLVLHTNDETKSPTVSAVVVDYVERVPTTDSWQVTFLMEDTLKNLNGNWIGMTLDQVDAQITAWANSNVQAAPLLMRGVHAAFDNKYVFIDPAGWQPIDFKINEKTREMKTIAAFTITEAA